MLFSFALLSYYIAELAEFCGFAALLVSSMVMTHYAWHNLSPQGKHVTSVTYQALGYVAEATVYCLVGLTFSHNIFTQKICWKFVGLEMIVIVIGRFAAVFISYIITRPCSKSKLTFSQLIFISYSGLVRGAIAFGFLTKISIKFDGEKSRVLSGSINILISLTIVVYGTLTPLLKKLLISKEDSQK